MKILLTGGGTAGHVTPNIALLPRLRALGFEIHYMGTENGMERKLIEQEGIPYHPISAGKLRRYFDMKNVTDILKIGKGFIQALNAIRKIKPDIVFSKGGFVSTPVVWAAWINRIPVVLHESDMTPGLANRLSIPFATTICYAFPETGKYLKEDKGVLTGLPVRKALFSGKADVGRMFCGFQDNKPVIMVMGGSQGSETLNKVVRSNLDTLLKGYDICHICGKGGIDSSLIAKKGYKQFEYISEEIPHIFAMSDIVVARAGATTLFELLALKKPNLLIPLSRSASRGDQILNAASFEKQGFSRVLKEEELDGNSFVNGIKELYGSRKDFIRAMEGSRALDGVNEIVKVIKAQVKC